MELDNYQLEMRQFADYPKELGPFAIILNLQSDVGTLSGKLRNLMDNIALTGGLSDEDKQRICISLGDILFDVTNIASDMQLSLNEIVSMNIKKRTLIEKRKQQQMENLNRVKG